MSFREELEGVIRKKALGFSYTEEVLECETVRPKPFVFCEARNRVYAEKGYFKVKKFLKNGEISTLQHKKVLGFVKYEKILNSLKSFKIKAI